MTLAEATRMNRLEELIAQAQAAGVGPADGAGSLASLGTPSGTLCPRR